MVRDGNVGGPSISNPVEDDATNLDFPNEFKNAETLLISEVFMLLDHRRKNEIDAGELEASEIPEVFSKAYKYTDTFGHFKTLETISVIRNILKKCCSNFHPFEVASLANLTPTLAEEAKRLIPSLSDKIDDEELQELLDEMRPYVFTVEE